jgi:hypothetical protein
MKPKTSALVILAVKPGVTQPLIRTDLGSDDQNASSVPYLTKCDRLHRAAWFEFEPARNRRVSAELVRVRTG